MSLVFERIQTEGIAELSYLVGDDSAGVAAVVDPTPDVDKYLALARKRSVAITHVFETHIHADLVSGATAWNNAGLELEQVGQMTVRDIHGANGRLQVADVRAPAEWEEGHVPGARHMFLPELREKSARLVKRKPVVVYCDSGYRASIGASILQQEGFQAVANVPGSWQAWQNAGFPVVGKNGK